VVRGLFNFLQSLGWGSGAIELLERDLTQDDIPIKSYDAIKVVTQTRVINLEELIVKYRPSSMTPPNYETWRKAQLRADFMGERVPSRSDDLKRSY
jgi:hypothetical protein